MHRILRQGIVPYKLSLNLNYGLDLDKYCSDYKFLSRKLRKKTISHWRTQYVLYNWGSTWKIPTHWSIHTKKTCVSGLHHFKGDISNNVASRNIKFFCKLLFTLVVSSCNSLNVIWLGINMKDFPTYWSIHTKKLVYQELIILRKILGITQLQEISNNLVNNFFLL